MILVRGRDWNIICSMLTLSEQRAIEATIVVSSQKPRAIFFDEDKLRVELRDKVKRLLDIKDSNVKIT